MEITYSFMVSADELKNHPVVHDIVEQILKQTMDCGCSIRGNMRRNFGERVVVHPFTTVDDQIAKFCTAFTDLRKIAKYGLGPVTNGVRHRYDRCVSPAVLFVSRFPRST